MAIVGVFGYPLSVAFQFGTAPLVESRMVFVGTLGTIAVDATLGGLASF